MEFLQYLMFGVEPGAILAGPLVPVFAAIASVASIGSTIMSMTKKGPNDKKAGAAPTTAGTGMQDEAALARRRAAMAKGRGSTEIASSMGGGGTKLGNVG